MPAITPLGLAVVVLAIAVGGACTGEPAAPATAAPMPFMPGMTAAGGMPQYPMGATAAPPVAMPEAEPTPEQLPVPEDFEEEAAAAIQERNLSAELDRIAREIEAEGG